MKRSRTGLNVLFLSILAACVLISADHAEAAPQELGSCTTIDESGSYVLKKSLEATDDCFIIAADFVTLDLAGFTISGNGNGDGVTDDRVEWTGTTIRNGTIAGFFDGIRLVDSNSSTIENINVIENDRHGINIAGYTVRHCTAVGNGQDGIRCGGDCNISDNVANDNLDDGIAVGAGCMIANNTAAGNVQGGLKVECPSNIIENSFTETNGDPIDFENQSQCNVHQTPN